MRNLETEPFSGGEKRKVIEKKKKKEKKKIKAKAIMRLYPVLINTIGPPHLQCLSEPRVHTLYTEAFIAIGECLCPLDPIHHNPAHLYNRVHP